jgi:limonene-1,2-epoxide hydrolase
MSTPSEVVERFMAAFSGGDAATLASFFTEDAVYHNMPLDPVQGRSGIEATIGGFLAMVEEIRFECLHLVAEGQLVMTERIDHFVTPERTISLPVMGAFEIEDGSIAAWRDYFDMQQFTAQLQSPT